MFNSLFSLINFRLMKRLIRRCVFFFFFFLCSLFPIFERSISSKMFDIADVKAMRNLALLILILAHYVCSNLMTKSDVDAKNRSQMDYRFETIQNIERSKLNEKEYIIFTLKISFKVLSLCQFNVEHTWQPNHTLAIKCESFKWVLAFLSIYWTIDCKHIFRLAAELISSYLCPQHLPTHWASFMLQCNPIKSCMYFNRTKNGVIWIKIQDKHFAWITETRKGSGEVISKNEDEKNNQQHRNENENRSNLTD